MGGEERGDDCDPRRYGNFQDPVGVILRMIRSGNRAARSALYLAALEQLVRPLDRALAGQEQRRLSEATAESDLPILLLVGSPRSGTTVVASLLIRALAVTYIDNFSAMFRRAPLTAARLSRSLGVVREGRSSLSNFYGNTVGISSPNDGFNIWNRWLGEDRYQPVTTVSDDAQVEMRRFFAAWSATFERPFFNKNNRNLGCIGLLSAALPSARFVLVRRRPLYIAQSLLLAREVVQGSPRTGWGYGAMQEPCDDPIADVVRQVHTIETTITTQRALVDPARILDVDYEDFCVRPNHYAQQIGYRLLDRPPRATGSGHSIPQLEPSRRQRLPSRQFLRLRRELEQAGLDCSASPL